MIVDHRAASSRIEAGGGRDIRIEPETAALVASRKVPVSAATGTIHCSASERKGRDFRQHHHQRPGLEAAWTVGDSPIIGPAVYTDQDVRVQRAHG
jgi:hypothetical protein